MLFRSLTPNAFKTVTLLTDSVYPTDLVSTVRPTLTPRGRLKWAYLSRNSFGIENIGNASSVMFPALRDVGTLPKAFEVVKSAEYKKFVIESLPKAFETIKGESNRFRLDQFKVINNLKGFKQDSYLYQITNLPKAFEKLLTPNISLRSGQIPPVKFYNNTVFDTPKVASTKLNFVLKDFKYNLQANFLPKPFEVVKGDKNRLAVDQFKVTDILKAIKQEGFLYQTLSLPKPFEKIVATDISLRTGQIPPVKFYNNSVFYTPQMANLPKAFEKLVTGDTKLPVSFLPKAFELIKGERNKFTSDSFSPKTPLKSIVNNVNTEFVLPVRPFRNNQVYFTPTFATANLGYVLKSLGNNITLGSSKLGYVHKGLVNESFVFKTNTLPKQFEKINGLKIGRAHV